MGRATPGGLVSGYVLLSDLLERPELLLPPPAVVPHLAWGGRVTLLAAEEKSGKSTLAGQAAAHLARGARFLGTSLEALPVLWLALDEPLADLVRRLDRFGARRGIAIMQERPAAVELQRAIEEFGARLLVVDTLAEFADGLVEDFNAAEQWTAHLRVLRQIAQATGCGVLLLHHTGRATGKYRGSSQIGAGVDAIIEMTADPTDPTVRQLRSRGRIRLETFRLRYSEADGYTMEDGELPLELQVYRTIEAHPGIGAGKLRDILPGRNVEKDAALADLLKRGAVQDRGTRNARAFYVRPENGWARSGQASGQMDFESAKSFGANDGQGLGKVPGNPACPYPLKGGTGQAMRGNSNGQPKNGAGPGLEPLDEAGWAGLTEAAAGEL